MGNGYSAYRIAKDHIHTDITCNTEKPQQKYRIETVSNRFYLIVCLRLWFHDLPDLLF